jgi:hypothetical protein
MTTQSITLHLSDPVYRYLQQVAAITKRPLEQVVRQSVEGNLPPSVENAPQELHDELLAMQSLSLSQLMHIASSQLTQAQQERYLTLLEQNDMGNTAPGCLDRALCLGQWWHTHYWIDIYGTSNGDRTAYEQRLHCRDLTRQSGWGEECEIVR